MIDPCEKTIQEHQVPIVISDDGVEVLDNPQGIDLGIGLEVVDNGDDTVTINATGGYPAGTFTPGSALFAATDGSITEDNANYSWDNTDKVLGLPAIDFDLASIADAAVEGRLTWDSEAGTLRVGMPGGDVVLQLGQEMHLPNRPKNISGGQINNGQLVWGNSATGAVPEMQLATATNVAAAFGTIAMATEDVLNNQRGFYATNGIVRDINTDPATYTEGDILYLSETPGEFTKIPPSLPAYIVPIGIVLRAHAVEGEVFIRISPQRGSDLANFFNGTFRESFDARPTSDGTTITMPLEMAGGGDLTMQFSDGLTLLDCCPASTIELTAGTLESPQDNFIYIPKATKVLTKSLSGYPAEEHIKIGYFYCLDAVDTQGDGGTIVNQNINDHLAGTNLQGHLTHMAETIRIGTGYKSGIDGAGTDQYTTSGAGTVYFKSTSGVYRQMHNQQFPAKDTEGTDDIHVLNDFSQTNRRIMNLYDVTTDANGGTLNNKYFSMLFGGVANKSDTYSPIFAKIADGSYNTLTAAEQDIDGYDNFALPDAITTKSSNGFWIARIVYRKAGGTWVFQSWSDLRRSTIANVSGAASPAQTAFSDNVFEIYNNADNTKELGFDVGNITPLTKRTITFADRDLDLDSPVFTNATVNGTLDVQTLIQSQTLQVSDNLIETRYDATVGLGVGVYTGLQAHLYDGVNDGQLVFDRDGWARVGDVGNLQKLATIEETSVDQGFAFYDAATLQLQTKLLVASDIGDFDTEVANNPDVADNTAKVSADGSVNTHSDVDTVTNIPEKNQVLKWDGTSFVPAAFDATFTFSCTSFSDGEGVTQLIGTGDWKAIGELSFSAVYDNGPPTIADIRKSINGGSYATISEMDAPTYTSGNNTVSVAYPPARDGRLRFRLDSSDGTDSDIDYDSNIYFRNYVRWGDSTTDSGFTEAIIEALPSSEITNSFTSSRSITAGPGEYLVLSYPSGYSSINANGFKFNGVTCPFNSAETVSITNSAGYTEDYKVFSSVNANLGSSVLSLSTGSTLIDPLYYGVTTKTSGYLDSDVTGLGNSEITNDNTQSWDEVTAIAGEYLLFSFPTRLGVPTFFVGGFEGGFESPETVSVTNVNGYTEDYYVWRSTNSGLGATNVVTQ